ncbi:homeobox protein dve-1 [Microplitis mediator]|uniref:homeobox protein dve-1 n=1 Tax=Microplitis mediator TaxID=375433 RepID=UPI00255747F7|nr:homeobox protein dve-1 [Microplitis mediator]
MDFQSAMETFAEAWVAANTKVDPVQSQALALTHKATPPSRSSSVSPIPRSPQSQQTAHTTNRSPTPRPASVQHPQLVHQPSQQQSNLISASVAQQPSRTEHQHQHHQQHQQQPQLSQAFGIHHNRHTKQEVDSSSPKPEGFDLSKNSSVTGKSPVPVHCIVESIHSIVDNRINLREKWPSPHIEIDTYVIIPASVPFQDLVGEALVRLGYPTDMIPSARGSIIVKNWRPLPMEKVADEPTRTVAEILSELTTVATLRIQIYRSRPPPASPAAEMKDKLLRLLLLHSHALLMSAGCPLDEMTLSSLCRGGSEVTEDTRRSFESWIQQQQLPSLGPPPPNPLLTACNNNRQLHNQSPLDTGGGVGPPHPHGHHPAMLPYSHKTRMRTSFDPELELPRLQRWFAENQHPSRQQIQRYVAELNSLESRRGRKPLDVNNVVYWFKNARAAQKRAENRGINGYSPPGLSPRGASIVSEDCSDEEDDSRHQSNSESPCLAGSPPVVGPLSLTTRSEDRMVAPTSTPTPAATATSAPLVKREDDSATRVSSGSDDEDSPPGVPTTPIPPGFSLVPSPMFGHSIMYMSHYLPTRGGPAGCPASLLDERRKRNRTFIDPVTEVPRLENWFGHNTHPSHALILKYTEELNRMPYRQKFPRLEPKNVQFWFKNRRAKCKRLKMALFEGESPQPHPYAHAD